MKTKLILFTSFVFLLTSYVFSQDGTLDSSFDTDGLVNTDINSDADSGQDVAIQSDGKIVVVGYSQNTSGNSFSVVRYNTNGTLDNTFDTDGIASILIGTSCEAYSVAIQPSDGKILVAGFAWTGSSNDFALARFNTDGSIDSTFGSSGSVTTGFGGDDHHGRSLAIQSDGKIILAGYVDGSFPGGGDFGVVRYDIDGSLDISFNGDGKLTTDFSGGYDSGKDVAIDSNGKIIVVGGSDHSTGEFAVARYNIDGSLDTSFDSDGKVRTVFGSDFDYAYCVAIQSYDRIVVGGQTFDGSYDNFAVIRYNTDGSLDNSFGTSGKASTTFGNSYDYAYDAIIQSDGKILLTGNSYNTTIGRDIIVVSRYNIDGTLDTSFDSDGKVSIDFAISPFYSSECWGIALQSNNKIVLAGSVHNGTNNDFAVMRLLNSASSLISVDITLFLEGPYNGTNMNASLTVPNDSPYIEDPENVNPIPSITNNEVVDWVLVELRDKTDESIILESQSAFVLQDGSIVDTDGSSPVEFSLSADNYYIAVKHRNHLAVMSASAIAVAN